MAAFIRIFLAVVFVVSVVGFGSSAEAAASNQYAPTKLQFRYCQSDVACNSYMSNATDACGAWASASSKSGVSWYVKSAPDSKGVGCVIAHDNPYDQTGRDAYTRVICDEGNLPDASTGMCTRPDPVCKNGDSVTVRQYYGNIKNSDVPSGFPSRYKGCEIAIDSIKSCQRSVATGNLSCTYVMHKTGNQVPTEASPLEASDDTSDAPNTSDTMPPTRSGATAVPCPKGSVQAGADADGVPLCIGTGTNPVKDTATTSTTKPPTTTTASDGTTTKTEITDSKNPDGSTTTTTKTTETKPDGTVSVSVKSSTSSTPSGSAGTPQSQESKDFCASHPELNACRNSAVSGTCEQIVCTGDAIQCATLRAAAAMQCKQKADDDALKAMPQKVLGDAILAGNDPLKGSIDTMFKGTEVDMSKGTLDQSGFIGAGACIADKTFQFGSRAVPVSFVSVCQNIQPLRYAVMACAFIVAYLLVARSVTGS